jgi:adenosylmethionine-8-amino-7-oxononanoate aminotransferase
MGHVFHRNPRHNYPVAVSGKGAYLFDADGKRYLDASGGAAVSCLGHSDPEVIAAIKAQLDHFPFAHTGFFTNEPMEQLAAFLADEAPDPLDRVVFVSGGSEAIEAAIKLARQYHVERGQDQRTRLIARRQSYYGNTLGALATGGNKARQRQFMPLLIEVSKIAPCYAYRGREPGESEEEYGRRVADELEAEVLRIGPETVIAFIAETIVGATLGAVPAVQGYFRRVREICDRYGILLILDEVMCGIGRAGTLFAFAQEGVVPDMLTVAKGLGAGYQPIGAVIVGSHIYETIRNGSGFFQHGHTYQGHATACAAGLAVQRAIHDRNLLERVRVLGSGLEQRLHAVFDEHPHIGDIRGRGLFRGIELVFDRSRKIPFDPSLQLHARIKSAAMQHGLICYPMGGTIDGINGDHILLAPPFILSDEQLDELVQKLSQALQTALSEIGNHTWHP